MKKIIILAFLLLFALVGCSKEQEPEYTDSSVVLRIGTPEGIPYEIIKSTKSDFEKDGYVLIIKTYKDEMQMNKDLEDDVIQCCFGLCKEYYEWYSNYYGCFGSRSIGLFNGYYIEYIGIYSSKQKDTYTINKESTILVPSEEYFYKKAMEYLEENNIKATIVKMDKKLIPNHIKEYDYVVLSGNDAYLNNCTKVMSQDSETVGKYNRVGLATRSGFKNDGRFERLASCLYDDRDLFFILDLNGLYGDFLCESYRIYPR